MAEANLLNSFVIHLERLLESGWSGQIAIRDKGRETTFGALASDAKRLAAWIIQTVPGRNRPIAVLLPKSAALVEVDLGILYSGNPYMNLDSHSPVHRIGSILEHIEPALIVTDEHGAEVLAGLGWNEERVLCVETLGTMPEGAPGVVETRVAEIVDADPMCIINTSGSTGVPKGVALTHRGNLDFLDWVLMTFPDLGTERIGSLSPLHFDIYTLELGLCMVRGATLVLIPEALGVFPARLMPFLQEEEITFLFWVPTVMVNIMNQGLLEAFPLPRLKTVFFAGEVFPMKHLNRWRKALPNTRFVNLYGPIEIHVDCTYFIVDRPFNDEDPLPIGLPCRNTNVLILDEEDRLCEPGMIGELCVRGHSLALGYWNDPERTAAVFVQNPLNKNYPERIYRTGDLVRIEPTGEIHFLGRKDFQIKHLGYRIELQEIEHHVQAIPGIQNACVLYNHPKKEITLFYEAVDDLPPAAIRSALGALIPKYMLPTAFHRMEELPRNPNGKIDRDGLRRYLEKGC